MARRTYIIAVSGGVDSVVLLHKLISVKPPHIRYIIAHLDHGIREDSAQDADFVKRLAKKYGTTCVSERVELGSQAGEEAARNIRYQFLRMVAKKYSAEAIITAHHQDDVIETMIVNMLRGTGPRGLIGYTSTDVLRPLLNLTKKDILAYAKQHALVWREDTTNTDESYLRNYVRKHITNKLSSREVKNLLELRSQVQAIYGEIDNLTKRLLVQTMKKGEIYRPFFVILPYYVQKELIAMAFRLKDTSFDRKTVERAVISVKTLKPGRRVVLKKNVELHSKKQTVLLKVGTNSV